MSLHVAAISVNKSETTAKASSVTKLTKTYVCGQNVLRTFTEIVATCKLNSTQGQGSLQIHIYIHMRLRVMHLNITHLVRNYKLTEITL